jgi:hypothetical protein
VATAKERTRLAVFLGTCKLLSTLQNKFLGTSYSANKRNPQAKKSVGLGKTSIIGCETSVYNRSCAKIADPALDYVVTTDASDVGIGAVPEQEYDDGVHPVAYASRKLNSAEQNYPTHDRELLYAVREWRPYLHGARFRILCDHHPLQYLETQPNFPNGKSDGCMLWPNLTTNRILQRKMERYK